MKNTFVTALAVIVTALASIAATPTPSPSPAIITPTSTVRFHFDPAPPAFKATGYEFFEKVGAVYVKIGPTVPTPIFSVANIGAKPRTFAARGLSAAGPGVMTDIVFPGAMTGTKYYVEILTK